MKLASHITCIFAIIAQIFLSSVAFAHDVTCQSHHSFSSSHEAEEFGTQHSHSCGCCHGHSDIKDVLEEIPSDTPSETPAPCDCSSSPMSSFITGEYSIETRARKILLIPFTSVPTGDSFLGLDTESANGVFNFSRKSVRFKKRIRLLFLPELSGRFVSTYFSKFLL